MTGSHKMQRKPSPLSRIRADIHWLMPTHSYAIESAQPLVTFAAPHPRTD